MIKITFPDNTVKEFESGVTAQQIAESISPERITVMIQKEMADRIMSAPGTEAYGALTVNLSLHYEPQFVINVPNDCFYPEPDVKSTVLNFIRRDIQIPHLVGKNFRLVVKAAFWGRRKTISKALSSKVVIVHSISPGKNLMLCL